MDAFLLKETRAPWGDYGALLKNGMIDGSSFAGETPEPLALSRTGPFVPPISFPWNEVVVTSDVRARIESESFTGVSFLPVSLQKCVKSDWTNWGTSDEMPEHLPAGNAPENYIDRPPHDAALARKMPKLWALFVPPNEGLQIEGTQTYYAEKAPKTDMFRGYAYIWVSARVADFFQTHYGEWVTCAPVTPQ